eukprot:1247805-Rhodomonas_salina.5
MAGRGTVLTLQHCGAALQDRLMSATMDFHASFSPHLITLTGSWANERHVRVQVRREEEEEED